MEPVDYADTFIAVAEDCAATAGEAPVSRGDVPSVAAHTYRLVAEHPYELTSGDVIFTVHADRRGIPEAERPAARAAFYAKGQPCLRASDLGKRYGWGVHADAAGRIALVGVETPEYAELAAGRPADGSGPPVTVTRAMRTKRAR